MSELAGLERGERGEQRVPSVQEIGWAIIDNPFFGLRLPDGVDRQSPEAAAVLDELLTAPMVTHIGGRPTVPVATAYAVYSMAKARQGWIDKEAEPVTLDPLSLEPRSLLERISPAKFQQRQADELQKLTEKRRALAERGRSELARLLGLADRLQAPLVEADLQGNPILELEWQVAFITNTLTGRYIRASRVAAYTTAIQTSRRIRRGDR